MAVERHVRVWTLILMVFCLVATTAVGAPSPRPVVTWWMGLGAKYAPYYKSFNEVPYVQELCKRLNMDVKFVSPPFGMEAEQFNLLASSQDLPDLVTYDWRSYVGGGEKAVKEGLIIRLNDFFDRYCPDLVKYLKSEPGVDKDIKTDSGTYFFVPYVFSDFMQCVYMGPQVRQDWLQDLGLAAPTTFDDWYTMLQGFKDKKGATAPLIVRISDLKSGSFVNSFGMNLAFYQQNGAVKFGPMESGYRQFLELMSKWYRDGLLDQDFSTLDKKTLDAKVTGEKAGAWIATTFGGVGNYLSLMKDKNPKFDILGATWPVAKRGDLNHLIPGVGSKVQAQMTAVSARAKDLPSIGKLLNYGFTAEGRMFYNYGVEGVSYTIVNGKAKLTDMVTKDTKLPLIDSYARFAPVADMGGPFVAESNATENMFSFPVQQQMAKQNWSKGDMDYYLPALSLLPSEVDSFSSIMTEVNTYVDESMLKFIMGQQSLQQFESYRQTLRSMKIDQAIAIEQNAYERYKKR
jgi:putative aldouronate transport system substrate-binding protein